MNSRKKSKIQVFGSATENSPKNDFQCYVTFWKCYFPTNFSHFLSYFLSFQTNFITENFKIYTLTQPKIKIKTFIHNIYIIYLVRGGRKIERLIRKVRSWYQWRTAAARSRKREIGINGGQRQLDRVGVGLPKWVLGYVGRWVAWMWIGAHGGG